MTKKGIIASVFAVICAVCLIVMACIFGIQASNASTTPATVNDKLTVAQGEKASEEGNKTDVNTLNAEDGTKVDGQAAGEGEVVVTNPEVTDGSTTEPEQTTDPEPVTPSEPTGEVTHNVAGDVNLDDKVDINDWTALRKIINAEAVPTEQQFTNGDVNKDGDLTTADLKLLKLNIDGVISLPNTTKYDCDLNLDGKTDVEDVKYWNNNIENLTQISAASRDKFDVDKNGKVNNTDYAIVTNMIDNVSSDVSICSVFFVDNFYGSRSESRVSVMTGHHLSELVPTAHARHAFSGWFTDAKCTMKFDFTQPIASDTVLYAKWTPIYYINFVDGENEDTEGVLVGETVNARTPTREGYDFDGWFTDKEFNNKFDFSTPLTKDYTVYAKWTKVFTVTYVNKVFAHDGKTMQSAETTEVVKVRDGEFAEKKELGTTRLLNNLNNGYAEFVGWSTTPIEITTWAPDAKKAAEIAKGDVKVKFFDFTKPITSDVTVYAKWIYHYVSIADMTLDDLVSAIDKEKVTHETDSEQMPASELYTYDLNFDNDINAADLAIWANTQGAKAAKITGDNKSADVNGDNVVDSKDVMAVAREIVAKSVTNRADVNGDLRIDNDDLASVLKVAGYNIDREAGGTQVVGDLNMDKVVDGLDSMILNKYLNNEIGLSDYGIKNADVNADGFVNGVDQQVFAMFLKHYIDALPHAFKGDAVDVNGDGKVDAEDTAAWKAIFEDYKKTIAEMEKHLDVNFDGKISDADLERISEYLSLNIVNLLDCSVEYEGKVTTIRELANSVFSKDKARNFKVTVKIADEKFISDVTVDTLNVITVNLANYRNGDKVEITYTFDQTGWIDVVFPWDANKQIKQDCKLVK